MSISSPPPTPFLMAASTNGCYLPALPLEIAVTKTGLRLSPPVILSWDAFRYVDGQPDLAWYPVADAVPTSIRRYRDALNRLGAAFAVSQLDWPKAEKRRAHLDECEALLAASKADWPIPPGWHPSPFELTSAYLAKLRDELTRTSTHP
jgi:hypothetical protein